MEQSDQKVSRDRYLFVPRTLIFATRSHEVLLLKGAGDKKLWPGRYNGIGGHVEIGEDILTAARREFKEETGLSLVSEHLSAVITINTRQSLGIVIFVFTGKCNDGNLVSSKEGEIGWFPIESIDQLDLVEDLYRLLPKILLNSESGMEPLYVHYSFDKLDRLQIQFASGDINPITS